MYPLFNSLPIPNDPVEIQRVKDRRPANQMEILQRGQQELRLHWQAIADQEARAEARERSPLQVLPNALGSIGRSIRRALGNTGERIGQQAA